MSEKVLKMVHFFLPHSAGYIERVKGGYIWR